MANTWHVNTYSSVSTGIAFGSAKNMFDIFNSSSSARYIRIYRIWNYNNSSTATTGVLTQLQLKLTNAMSGGSVLTSIAHNTGNSALNANTTIGYGRTCGNPTNNLLRQYIWSNEEWVLASGIVTLNTYALETLLPVCQIWDLGYADSAVNPITLRASNSEGVAIFHPGTSTSGFLECEAEFTDAAS